LRKLTIACLAIAAMLVQGCGTMQAYEGPRKAAHEVAVLRTNIGEPALDAVWVGRLDGRRLDLAYAELEVAPGLHSAQVLIKRGFVTRSDDLSFDAKAGHHYRVKGDFHRGRAWVLDERTGELVAGEKP